MHGMGFVKPWLWPHTYRNDVTFSVRLGRLVHWLCVAFATCAATFGMIVSYGSYVSHQRSLLAISAWYSGHHLPPLPEGAKLDPIPPPPDGSGIVPVKHDEWDQFADAPIADSPPDEQPVDYTAFVVGLAVGAAFGLVGR